MSAAWIAIVIGVGTELLNGRTANTNAQWLCGEIYSLGGTVKRALTVPDDLGEISAAVRETVAGGPRWIVITGGLGPTYDDMTLRGVADALGVELVEDSKAKEMILFKLEEYREKGRMMSLDYTPERAKMALIPKGGVPLSNSAGTAPGVLFDVSGTLMACLPGVPAEMKAIFLEHLAPRMAEGRLRTVTLDTEIEGLPEAALAPTLAALASKYPEVYVKSHPKGFEKVSKVLVQLTGRGGEGVRQALDARDFLIRALTEMNARYHVVEKQDHQ
jgi:nicotinamide-nucleotide amidase